MKEFGQTLVEWAVLAFKSIVDHPLTYGLLAGIARWLSGDRMGGFWSFAGYVFASVFVAITATYWFLDGGFSENKRIFFTIIVAFVARDILSILILLGERARTNPMEMLERIISALKGGPR